MTHPFFCALAHVSTTGTSSTARPIVPIISTPTITVHQTHPGTVPGYTFPIPQQGVRHETTTANTIPRTRHNHWRVDAVRSRRRHDALGAARRNNFRTITALSLRREEQQTNETGDQ
jgi:hypothetical protein